MHKKFIKRGGKTFGPYYYKSYREGDKIKTAYIGKESAASRITDSGGTFLYKIMLLISIIVLLMVIFPILEKMITALVTGQAPELRIQATNCGDTINQSTNLTNDLLECPGNGLIIGNDSITLDCQGWMIDGNRTKAGLGNGIIINNKTGVTIKNCIVRDFVNIIDITLSESNILLNNTIGPSTSGYGIWLTSSSHNNTIENSYISGNGDSGIAIGSDNNTLINNVLAQNANYDLTIYGNYNIVRNNSVTTGTTNTLEISGSNNNIINSTFVDKVWIAGGMDNEFLNTLFDRSKLSLYAASTNLSVKWYLDVLVKHPNGTIGGEKNITGWENMTTSDRMIPFTEAVVGTTTGAISDTAYQTYQSNVTVLLSDDTWKVTKSFVLNESKSFNMTAGGSVTVDFWLENNISCTGSCFEISADNITINCRGNSITGNGSGDGISFAGSYDNITIKNCNISNFYNGIYTTQTTSGFDIINSYISASSEGVLLNNKQNVLISNSTILGGDENQMLSVSNATIINSTLSGTNFYGLFISGENITLENNAISGATALKLGASISSKLINQPVGSYDFSNIESLLIENNEGEILYLQNITQTGTNFSNDLKISNNLIEVDSSKAGLNKSANLTLYSPIITLLAPYYIARNGIICNETTVPSCYNLTALNAANVIFNVSSFTNYSILGTDTTAPAITIVNPANGSSLAAGTASTAINISTDENAICRYELTNSTFNFENGINFTNTGSLSHNFLFSGLSNGQTYLLYYKCNDSAGNVNANSTSHSFSVSSGGGGGGGGGGCTDDCTPSGSKRCFGAGYQTCGNYDADSCLEWSTVTDCSANETCQNGNCVLACTNDCASSGLKECYGNYTQRICGNYDADPCLEWLIAKCPPGDMCNNTNAECYTPACMEDWFCEAWQSCTTVDGNLSRQRICSDLNYCETNMSRPAISEACCPDLTISGECSVNKPKYCDAGNLADNCTKCGCLQEEECNITTEKCYLPGCSSDADCPDGFECNIPTGECLAIQPECVNDTDCGFREQCWHGICRALEIQAEKAAPLAAECVSEYICGSWSDCAITYGIKEILSGELASGTQTRECIDMKGCKPARLETRSCLKRIPVRVEKEIFCFQNFINIYDEITGKLVSRLKQGDEINKVDVELGDIAEKICFYCMNGIKDYDEIYIDCGGAYCKYCNLDEYTEWLAGNEIELTFTENSSVKFSADSMEYVLAARRIADILSIELADIRFDLNAGETETIDVNGDDTVDVIITLLRIEGNKAIVTAKKNIPAVAPPANYLSIMLWIAIAIFALIVIREVAVIVRKSRHEEGGKLMFFDLKFPEIFSRKEAGNSREKARKLSSYEKRTGKIQDRVDEINKKLKSMKK